MELHDGDRDHLRDPAGCDLLRVPPPDVVRADDGRRQGLSLAIAATASDRRRRCGSLALFATALLAPLVALAQGTTPEPEPPAVSITLPTVEVIGVSPVPGLGIDHDKLPGTTRTIGGEAFTRTGSPYVSDTLFQQAPGLTLSDPNGNAAAQEVDYRGFAASPLQGTPQGIAVYLSGIRLNEAFGDAVNWDLIPSKAIEHADLLTNNPVFGLNALGGAVNLQTKNGFTSDGKHSELQGGSFGRVSGSAEYGVEQGDHAIYVAAEGSRDDGWRRRSRASLGRAFADLGWRDDRAELHLIGAAAASSFGAAAATPVELLDRDRSAVFTTPQTTDNAMALLGLGGKYTLSETWSLQGNLYVRGFHQHHIDGNPLDSEGCSGGSSAQFLNHLCLQDDAFPRPSPVTTAFHDQFAILDQTNSPIPCPPGPDKPCDTTPYGTIDRTTTRATTAGASLQASTTETVLGHGNQFIVGGSVDHGSVNFAASSVLGFIDPSLTVVINPSIRGTGAIIHALGDLGLAPVEIDTSNTYYGAYLLDVVDLTDRLSATAGVRLNIADIAIHDRTGASPDLNSNAAYTRVNPVAGLTYKLALGLVAYAGYSEANRAPTPLELGCASRTKPCLLESFLVSDPPLKQVVARTVEIGLRGRLSLDSGKLDWQIGLFRTDTADDIVTVASIIQGRGFFQNVPGTRRQGAELSLRYQWGQWAGYAGYNFLDATYQFTGDLPSPNNPFADHNGNVHVTAGKGIPGIPQHQVKLGFDFVPNPQWKLGADLVVVGSKYLVGDDANQNPKLPGYAVVNLHASYQVTETIQVFGLINNLFDSRYALFGTFFESSAVRNAGLPIVLRDHRAEVLGQPLSVYAGVRINL